MWVGVQSQGEKHFLLLLLKKEEEEEGRERNTHKEILEIERFDYIYSPFA